MVKLPPDVPANAPGVEKRTQLLHDLGALIAMWSELEITLEVAIQKITGISPLHTSILLGSLQFGTKRSILSSLLAETGDTATTTAVKELVDSAKRNALMHSAIAAEDDYSQFVFFYRNVKEKYGVTKHEYSAATFHGHFLRFRELHGAAITALKVTQEEINEYGREARFEGVGR